MLADFYIRRLSNDMKLAIQKNHLGVKFCTELLTLLKNDVIIANILNIKIKKFLNKILIY